MQQYLEAGKVVTTHGVRGEMKLELWCDGVDFLKKTGRLYASAKGGKCYNIISIRPQGQMALLQLEGVNDMDAARALRGQVFYFDRSDATLPEGRWYVADLIGCEVRDADTGKVYGVVTSVDQPRRAGHLHRQGPQRQRISVPRCGRLFERAEPAGGVHPRHAHPRIVGRRLRQRAGGGVSHGNACGHRDPLPGDVPAGAGCQHFGPCGKAGLY